MYSKNTAGSGRFMKHIRINGKRTVSKGKYLWKAVLFCVGALLLYDSFHERNVEEGEETGTGRYVVVRESLAGQEEVPLEEYLIGALAGSLPEDFSPQACRAQAVVLRTNAVCLANETGTIRIDYQSLGQKSLTMGEMREKWGDGYEEQYEAMKSAVNDTKNQIVLYEGIPVELPFFLLSAGHTRDASALPVKETFPYLQSVDCGEDVFADAYEQERVMGERELGIALAEMFEADTEIFWEDTEAVYDHAGYMTEIGWNGKRISGEQFREKTGLPSACITMEKDGRNWRILTKGIGHGLGMSLYTANDMAKSGKDYREILKYFFPDCEIAKN